MPFKGSIPAYREHGFGAPSPQRPILSAHEFALTLPIPASSRSIGADCGGVG